jgi:hypothetical protein
MRFCRPEKIKQHKHDTRSNSAQLQTDRLTNNKELVVPFHTRCLVSYLYGNRKHIQNVRLNTSAYLKISEDMQKVLILEPLKKSFS